MFRYVVSANNTRNIVDEPLIHIINKLSLKGKPPNGQILLTQLNNGIIDSVTLHKNTVIFNFQNIIKNAKFTDNEDDNALISKRIFFLFNKLKSVLIQDSNIDFAMFIGQLSRAPGSKNVNQSVNKKFIRANQQIQIDTQNADSIDTLASLCESINDDDDDIDFGDVEEEEEEDEDEDEDEEEASRHIDELRKQIKERREKKEMLYNENIIDDLTTASLNTPMNQSQTYDYIPQQRQLSKTYKSIYKVIRNWYKKEEGTIKENFVKYQTNNAGTIKKDTRADSGSRRNQEEKPISYSIADIYPAEKVIMMILYLAMYDLSPDPPAELDDLIAVYCVYVQLFNSFCACRMESTWNEKIQNEYVYIPNVNVRDGIYII